MNRRSMLAATVAVGAAALIASPPSRAAEPPVRLTVSFFRSDDAVQRVAHLRCAGRRATADGYLRDLGAARACRLARGRARLLASAPDRRRACSQIYGGPERARVRGRIGRREIGRSFSRSDGCRIGEWDRAVPLLPRPRPGATGP